MAEENSNNQCCPPPAGPAPWLVYTHGNARSKKFQAFCTLSSSPPYTKHYFKSTPQLRCKSIVSSNDGWLLLRGIFTLWNPISSQTIHLPPLNALEDDVDVNVRRIELEAGEQLQYSFFVTIKVNNHGSDIGGLLTLRLLQVKAPSPGFIYIFRSKHLVASCGRVYAVGVYSRYVVDKWICAVNICKLDLCLMKWVQVKCLEGRAFFVGRSSCTWCWGTTDNNESGGIKQNFVYFEVYGNADLGMQDLYSYNLEDGTLTSFLPCLNRPCFWDDPTWIMPRYQRLGKDEDYKHCNGKVGLLKQGLGATQCQGLQEQNEERTQHKSSGSSDALSLTFDKQKQNDVLDKFLLCELPLDLIALVAKHMHLFDYMNFRATCNRFRSVTPIAQWRTNNSYPLLMFFESEELRCRIIDPCRSDSCYMVVPEFFRGVVDISSSKDGWLLLHTNEGLSLHFCNPFTGVRGEFPHCSFMRHVSSVGFSSCPTSSDCITVGITWFHNIYICYHRFEEEMWHECEFDYDDEVEFLSVLSSPVYHKGAFYFWDFRGYLGVFELVNEQGTWDVYDRPQTLEDSFHSSHLVECGGELLSVFFGDTGNWVRVFRFDQRKMKWVRVESLGNHVLFVGHSSSFSVVAKEREMANRIYLPRLCGNGFLFYALDTGKYSTHMGEEPRSPSTISLVRKSMFGVVGFRACSLASLFRFVVV